jgi:predicted metal-dependent phosphoesterase TrpH
LNASLKVDLHCHSHFSDGTLSPVELVDRAIDAKIDLLALTDHDTTAGVDGLCQAALHHSIRIIKGVEISVRWKLHDIHILGLNLDIESPVLTKLLLEQHEKRAARAQQIALQLAPLGLNHIYQQACELAGHTRIGRPHFAQVLLNEGIAPNLQAAFKRYLVRGCIGFVPTAWVGIEDAITAIIQSGGVAVIAHPLKYKLTRSKLLALIECFKDAGGRGVEVVSGEMTLSDIGTLVGLCNRYDLLASSGSDFHGDTISRIKLGHQRPLPLNCKSIWEEWC